LYGNGRPFLERCAWLVKMQQKTAVREMGRIVGETLSMHEDYVGGRRFDDAGNRRCAVCSVEKLCEK
jgi:hypothetical protein